MTSIELTDVTKVFEDDDEEILAVDGVSISIDDGELVVFVGPSGSGKSTTLQIVAGLEQPTSGEIRIGGQQMTDVPPQDRNVAMVFQSFALYPHRTVKGTLSFPLQAQGIDEAEIDERTRNVAETLGIAEMLDRKPSQLSGGQQQRVALGRAIIRDPQAFLMDQGTIQQVGQPDVVYRRPANRFVAKFIGSPSMNLPVGRVENGSFVTDRSGVSLSLPDRFADAAPNTPVTRGIRPEDVTLAGAEEPHTFGATVDVVELLGNFQVVYFGIDGTEFLAEIDPDHPVSVGDEVRVRLQPDTFHLFDGTDDNSERIAPTDEPTAPGSEG